METHFRVFSKLKTVIFTLYFVYENVSTNISQSIIRSKWPNKQITVKSVLNDYVWNYDIRSQTRLLIILTILLFIDTKHCCEATNNLQQI